MKARREILVLAAVLVGALLGGCGGSSAPKPKNAAKEIEEAERAMSAAQRAENDGNYDLALTTCRQALDPISKGKGFATGVELIRLQNLESDVRHKLNDLDIKKTTQKKTPDSAKAAAGPASDVLDPAALKRQQDLKKKEEEAALQRKTDDEKKSVLTEVKKGPKQDEPEDAVGTAPDKAAGPGDTPAAAQDTPKKPAGLFPEVNEKSPPRALCHSVCPALRAH